jgi:ankyrin repeat protein
VKTFLKGDIMKENKYWLIVLFLFITIALPACKRKGASRSRKSEGRALHDAAGLGNIEAVKVLLASGADVNAINNDGETPLHIAAYSGMPDIAKLLLDAGADINAKTKEGKTPLDYLNEQISHLEQMMHGRPVADKGLGKQIVSFTQKLIPSLLQRYKACAEVLREHGAK